MKQDRLKEKLIKELKEMPVIQFACKRTDISRATFYRWRNEDKSFAKEIEKTITEGEELITDMSESQLISLIKDKSFQALKLWLRHHHPKYSNKVELTGQVNVKEEPLTKEQKKMIRKALRLSSVYKHNISKKND